MTYPASFPEPPDEPSTLPAPAVVYVTPEPPSGFARLKNSLIFGLLVGLILALAVGYPLAKYVYRTGKTDGAQALLDKLGSRDEAVRYRDYERRSTPFQDKDGNTLAPDRNDVRTAIKDDPVPDRRQEKIAVPTPQPPTHPGDPDLRIGFPKPAPAAIQEPVLADNIPVNGVWCFGPSEAVRAVWPMEAVERSADIDHPHFRIRQGANRLAREQMGLAEFVFKLDRPAYVSVYARCRHLDECGNSLTCTMDGGPQIPLGNSPVYGSWIWERAYRRFELGPGLHRLTIYTCEDGLEFDRVIVSTRRFSGYNGNQPTFDDAPFTPPPVARTLPPASPVLPAIGPITASAFATESLVIGKGHRNRLSVMLRLLGPDAIQGEVHVTSLAAGFSESRTFQLNPNDRTQFLNFDLALRVYENYFVPVQIEVLTPDGLVHSQRIDFIRPLVWAFLGPVDDPERKGLDLPIPGNARPERLNRLPPIPGHDWRIVEDGSCYDDFGVVDLNKVYGRPNLHWHENEPAGPQSVVWAVTCVASNGTNHSCLAYGGDDSLRVWLNGRQLLRQENNAPLETTRCVLGTELQTGRNVFVFQVPQNNFYWQLLFEPDLSFPYGRLDRLDTLPVSQWK